MHKTQQGECWDEAAKTIYEDEKYIGFLMQNNMPLLDIAVFPAGVVLNTPDLPVEVSNLPAWRKRG